MNIRKLLNSLSGAASLMTHDEILRPVVIAYAQRDFRIAYLIARALGYGESVARIAAGTAMGDVWIQIYATNLIPSTFKVDHLTHVLTDPTQQRHWGLDVSPGMIAQSKSLLVILSRYSVQSPEVALEIAVYPRERPVVVMPLDRTQVPHDWKTTHPGLRVCSLPAQLNIREILSEVISDAQKSEVDGRLEDAYKLHHEGINIHGLVFPDDMVTVAQMAAVKGGIEIRMGLAESAVQTLTGALALCERFRGSQAVVRIQASDGGTPRYVLAPPRMAMQAHLLVDLGWAHNLASKDLAMKREDQEAHRSAARTCMSQSLKILERGETLLKELPDFPYAPLRECCVAFLEETSD